MASIDDVTRLAALARIEVSETQLSKFAEEFGSILSYIGAIERAAASGLAKEAGVHRNVMREDKEPHERGKYTDALVSQFPKRKGNALSVKQIISHE